MKKTLLSTIILFFAHPLFAQPKQAVAATPAATTPPVAIVSTKELKRRLESNFKRKKYKLVLPIADTLLKRNKKDENAFFKKVSSEIYLKMDKQAMADFRGFYKNKDSGATILSLVPYKFDFKSKNRSGDMYYKSAMAWAPKNGIPFMMYGAEMADQKKYTEAVAFAKKGYNLLNPVYKKAFVSTYAYVLHAAGNKEDAFQLLEGEMKSGNMTDDVVNSYFGFFIDDNELQQGIDKATELIKSNPAGVFYSNRSNLYSKAGNSDKACEDATTLKDKFSEGDYWLKKYNCAQVMADITPTKNRTYIYEVVFNGNTYDFRVSNPVVDMQNGISFKYKLTADRAVNGTVTMSKEAVNTASKQMNHFGMEAYDLTDKTTVWVSNKVYGDLKTNGEALIDGDVYFGTGSVVFTDVTDKNNTDEMYYPVTVDAETKYIKCIKILGKDGEEMWINDDAKNPLILKMKTDFTIELKQVL